MANLWVWIGIFAVTSLFYAWILFWGGADWLEGSFAAGFLFGFKYDWSAEGIKLIVLVMWVVALLWFVLGLFVPAARIYH